MKKFDPKKYQNKKRVQTPTLTSGISKCWTWDEDIKEYLCKSFEARKTSPSGRLKEHFDCLDDAKAWLYGTAQQQIQSYNCPKFKEVVEHWHKIHMPLV